MIFMTDINLMAENAMKAFDAFKSEIQPKLGKLDAFDAAKFDKLQNELSDAVEVSQKQAAKAKQLEDEVELLKKAAHRPAASASQNDEAKAAVATAFKEFATKGGNRDFADFLKETGKDMEFKTLSVNVDSQGGYLVMPEFGGLINTRIYETSPLRELATVRTIGTDALEIVTQSSEFAAGWVSEAGSRAQTDNASLNKIIIPTHEMYANPYATQKVLDDAAADLESWVATYVGDKLGRLEATSFVSGTGANSPKGILNYTAGTDVTLSQIEQINMGSISAVTYDGLVDLQNALKEPYQANATFIMKRATFGNLMKVKTGISGDNRPVFNMMHDKNTGLATSVLGRPVRFADDMQAIGSANLAIAYGDFRTAYVIADRQGVRVLRDPYSSKPYVQFYTTKRVGGGVVNFEAIKLSKFST
jgi:HK97 family phage major capsid protein